MQERVIGYVLLIVGVGTILFAGVNTYMVFTKKIQPIQLFSFAGVSLDMQQMVTGQLSPEQASFVKKQTGEIPKTEIIPANFINDTSNIFAHLMLMGFVASIGYKLASLGTMMTRPIIVKAKNES